MVFLLKIQDLNSIFIENIPLKIEEYFLNKLGRKIKFKDCF